MESRAPEDGAAGYTLVETIVSMAILTAAVFPLVAAVMLVGLQPQVRHLQVATGMAHNEIERTLRLAPQDWTSSETRAGRWRIRREVEHTPRLTTVRVEVVRATTAEASTEPLVELSTARLVARRDAAPGVPSGEGP